MKDRSGPIRTSIQGPSCSRLLPPVSAAVEEVALAVGVGGTGTRQRGREDAQSRPARGWVSTAAARLEAVVITTAAMAQAQQELPLP